MTEKDIARSISKHSVKPFIGLAILTFVMKMVNGYFFESDPISPLLIIIFSICGCMYIFQKVLVDLLIIPEESMSIKE